MHRIVTILLLLFITASVSFAQRVNVPIRTLNFYVTAYSGDFTESPDGSNRLFSGNEFEIGAIYSQNFASANWLSVWVKALVITGTKPEYNSDDKYVGNQKNGYGILPDYGEPQAQVGLNFGNYSTLGIDTRGLLVNENYYPLNFGDKGKLTFVSILELFPIPIAGTLTDGTDRITTEVLDLFAIRIDYSIHIIDSLLFTTKLAGRFSGVLGENEIKLTSEQFLKNFSLRFENQLIWTISKFHMWAQLRYDIANLTSDLKVDHRIGIEYGLAYSFNLSLN